MLEEICVNKIRALSSAYVTEKELQCRNCEGEPCPDYHAYVPSMQIPIRYGIVASKLMEKKEK